MSESMTPLALSAKRVIDAAWLHGEAYDLSSQAAFALESAQMLQSPETAAEHQKVRAGYAQAAATVAELVMKRGERMKVENALRDEVEELRARVAELEGELARASQVSAALRSSAKQLLRDRRELEGEFYASVHHEYRTGRDLPELGGA